MSRFMQFTAAASSLLFHHTMAQTSIISVLEVGQGASQGTVLNSDSIVTASVVNAAPTGTTYLAYPSFAQSDIDMNGGADVLSSAYGATYTLGPSAYDMYISVKGGGRTVVVSTHCEMSGTLPTICTTTGPGTQSTDEDKTFTRTIFPGTTDFYYVPITANAGLEKLASASVPASSTAAAPSSSSANTPAPSNGSQMAATNTLAPSASDAAAQSGTPTAATATNATGVAGRNTVVGISGIIVGLAGAMLNAI